MDSTTIIGLIGVAITIPAWFFFLRGAWTMYSTIARGKKTTPRAAQPVTRLGTLIKEVVLHTELFRKPVVAVTHWLVMVGFLLGSVVWFEAYIQMFNPAGGWPLIGHTAVYHFIDELLGLGTVIGILVLMSIHWLGSRHRGTNWRAALFVELVVLLEGLGMVLVKAGKIATYGGGHPVVDFFSRFIAELLPASPVLVSAFAFVKLATGTIWLWVVGTQLSWGVAWHRFLAFFNIFLQRHPNGAPALGALAPLEHEGMPLTLDNADDAPRLGVGSPEDLSWKALLDVHTCTECNRCQELCPAWNTGKPLSPRKVITGLRDGVPITDDELWACTNCGACVEQCPVDIEHIDHVANLRRYRVLEESQFPSELTGMFKNLEVKGNPWGRNKKDRMAWVTKAQKEGIDVPVLKPGDSAEKYDYLLWVGCAGSLDDHGVKTSRALVELLNVAGVSFAVLDHETCTGDPARRAGNEFLFQQLAQENIDNLNAAGVKTIITSCAHCFNTFSNEYPDFGGNYRVLHHTQLLNRLVRDGKLKPVPRGPEHRERITYHDPCFLGRHNKVFDPPRELLEATGAELAEMPHNKNEAFCCGAGGARMFMEENIGRRISDFRAEEAASTGATDIAVACPFCSTMLETGVKSGGYTTTVTDVAVRLRDSILVDGALPLKQTPTTPTTPATVTMPATTPVTPATAAPTPPASRVTTPTPVAPTPAAPKTPVAPQAATPTSATPVPGVPKAATPTPTPAAPTPTTPRAPIPATPAASNPVTSTPVAPTPAAPAAPTPAVPKVAAPTPAAPTPAAPAAPTPAAPTPAVPKVAAPTPAVPTPAAPTPAVPRPAAPKVPTPKPSVPKPGKGGDGASTS
ncbi:(Fe-S)-binding protein [Corynebacterium pyruviciproducens]